MVEGGFGDGVGPEGSSRPVSESKRISSASLAEGRASASLAETDTLVSATSASLAGHVEVASLATPREEPTSLVRFEERASLARLFSFSTELIFPDLIGASGESSRRRQFPPVSTVSPNRANRG